MSDEQAVANASLRERFELASEQADTAVSGSLLTLAAFLNNHHASAADLEAFAVLNAVLLQQQVTLKQLVDAVLDPRL